MSQILKVGEKDLSAYVRVAHEDGLDPANHGEFSEPQFSGAPAFSEGQSFVGDAVSNRLMSFPLILKAANTVRTNLIPNPSFEVNTTGWVGGAGGFRTNTGATLTQDAGQHQVGTAAAKLVTPGAKSSEGLDLEQVLPVVSGITYRISAYVKGNAGGESLQLVVGDGTVGSATKSFVASTGWQRVDVSLTPGASGNTGVAVRTNGTAAVTFWVDGVLWEAASTLGPYFDGDQASCHWTGVPHASISETLGGTDGLYQLVREINGELIKGESVEYRSGGASVSTFFDLERGRLEPQFEFWIDQAARVRAMLHLWVRPYGHTGTTRIIATATALAGPQLVTVPGILGDVPARANLYAQASLVSGDNILTMYGVKSPAPSGWSPIATAAGLVGGESTASVFGASGRVASNYAGYAVTVATTRIQGLKSILFRPQDFGRYRVFADVRLMVSSATTAASMFLHGQLGNSAGTAMLATSAQAFQVLDLGEVAVPTTTPTPKYELSFVGASGASPIATYPLQIDTVIFLPLDTSVGLSPLEGKPTPSSLWRVEARGVQREFVNTASGGTPVTADRTAEFRGDFPLVPPVGTFASNGPAQILIWSAIANSPDVLGNRPADYGIAVRERFSFLR